MARGKAQPALHRFIRWTRFMMRRSVAHHLLRRAQRVSLGRMFLSCLFTIVWNMVEVFKGVKMSINGAQQQITDAVRQWPDITVSPHRFGGVEYQLGKR